MSLFRGISFENLKDGEYIQFFGVHMLSWGDIERATGIKPTIAFIEDDTLEKQNADLVAMVADLLAVAEHYKPLPKGYNPEDEDEEMWAIGQLYYRAEQVLAQVKED